MSKTSVFGLLLLEAARAGSVSTVLTALRLGADVDVRDAEGRTPLMLAAHSDHVETVSLLLSRGADAGLYDENRLTALDHSRPELFEPEDDFTVAYPERTESTGVLLNYWRDRYLAAKPVAPHEFRPYLEAYSNVEGNAAFRLRTGHVYEGFFRVDEGKDAIYFTWAPSPFDCRPSWPESEEIPIQFSQIDPDSLYW